MASYNQEKINNIFPLCTIDLIIIIMTILFFVTIFIKDYKTLSLAFDIPTHYITVSVVYMYVPMIHSVPCVRG